MGDVYDEQAQDIVDAHLCGDCEELRLEIATYLRAAADGARREALDRMLDGCIAFLMERGQRDLAAEMRARIMEHPEMAPDPVAAAREAVFLRAMEWFNAPEYGDEDAKFKLAESCAVFGKASKDTYCECGCGGWCNNGAALAALETKP